MDMGQMNRESAHEAIAVAIPALIEAIGALYRQYDRLVTKGQDGVMAISRQLGNLQVTISELETQLSAMMRAVMVPGGRVLHVLHDVCSLDGVEYSTTFSGYRLIPKLSQNVLTKHPLSSPEFIVVYSSGDAEIDGDPSSLYDGTDNTSVYLRILRDTLVSHSPDNAYIPQYYRGGAVAYLCAKMYHQPTFNRIVLKTAEPVYLLGWCFESHNWLNSHNLWPDVYGSDAGWVRKDGSAATRQWDSFVSRNVLTLQPDSLDSYISITPRNIVLQSGRTAHETVGNRCIYGVEISYLVHYAPVELTVTVYDSNGRAFVSQTKVLKPGNNVSMMEYFFGGSTFQPSFGISFSVKRVGNRVGKLWIRSMRVCDWLWTVDLNLPIGTVFDVPVSVLVPSVVGVVVATPHVKVSDSDRLEYFCNVVRFEVRNDIYIGDSLMVSPQIPQSTHPISNLRVFLEGENLDNSDIVVGSDSTFTRSVTVPASAATAPGGLEVSFVPYIIDESQIPQLPGYSVPVPMQYVSESFTHGQEFTLRYVPYCHPMFLRSSMTRLGRYEPNFDTSEVDPSRIEELGITLRGDLTRTVETRRSEWSGIVLGSNEAVLERENEYFLEGVLPGYTSGSSSVSERRTDHNIVGSVRVSKFPSMFTVDVEVMNRPRGPIELMPSGSQYITDYEVPDANSARKAYEWTPVHSDSAAIADPNGSVQLRSYRDIGYGQYQPMESATRTLTNPLPSKALMLTYYAGGAYMRRVSFPGNVSAERGLKLKKGRYRFSVTVATPHTSTKPPGTPDQTYVALQVWSWGRPGDWSQSGSSMVEYVTGGRGQSVNIEYELNVINDDQVYYFHLFIHGDAAIAFPEITEVLPPAVSEPVGTDKQRITNSLPASSAAGQTLTLRIDTQPVEVRVDNRVELPELALSGFVVDGSGQPVIQAKAVIDGVVVNLTDRQHQSFAPDTEGGTFQRVSWRIPNTGRLTALLLQFTATATANNKVVSVTLKRSDGNLQIQLVESITSYNPGNAPSNPTTILAWRSSEPVEIGKNGAISFHVRLRGFERNSLRVAIAGTTMPSRNVQIIDDQFVDTDTVRTVRVVVMPNMEHISSLELVVDSPLFSQERVIYLGVDKVWRISSVFDTLVPVRVTLITPYGTFVPDVIGPVPIGGTRYVENERLEPASDRVLEQYEQEVVSGAVSRTISQDRPVYATMFAPIVNVSMSSSTPQLKVDLYDRSSNTLVRTLRRSEYIVDRERGLIQPLINVGDDHYLVASYRFRVVSESQLKLYESRVRSELITRNRTDYLFGSIPQLKPFRFGADEVRNYTVMEYYHQGNKLTLSGEVPAPIDATYAIHVSYWYLPVDPAVKLVLRRTSSNRVPIVRKLVVQT